MTSRRTVLGLGATASVGLLAGCLDFVTGDEPLEFEAERAAPSDQALEETGFEVEKIEEEEIEEVVDVGVEREFRATFWVSAYSHELEIGGQETQGAAFTAVSIPGMEVLGSQQNPIADMDNEELLDEFRDEFPSDQGEISDVSHRSSHEYEVLGADRDVDVFDAVAERSGQQYDVLIEMTNFEHEDDILVLVGVYPEDAADDPPIGDLMRSTEHPVE